MKKSNVYDHTKGKMELWIAQYSNSEVYYKKYLANRNLRDVNGKGVLIGLTNILEIIYFKDIDGVRSPVDGELWYRGYRVNSLIGELGEHEFGFEITATCFFS